MSADRQFNCLFVGDVGSHYRTGGGYTFARNLLEQLLSIENLLVTPVVYQSRRDQGTVDELMLSITQGLVPYHVINAKTYGIGKPSVDIYVALALKKLIKKMGKIDLLVLDQPNPVQHLFKNIPSIVMLHGGGFSKQSFSLRHPRSSLNTSWSNFLLSNLYKKYLNKTCGYTPLFNSLDTLAKLSVDFNISIKQLNDLEAHVTWLPVDTDVFQKNKDIRSAMRSKYKILDDEVVIIYLSNFNSETKRAYLAPILLGKIVQQPKVRIFFVGAGNDDHALPLDEFCRLHKNAQRIKEIPLSDAPAWFNMADIAVSFSYRETFGYTIVEGMACELPTVIFALGALKEHIKNGVNGFSVNSNQEFAESLISLATNPELRKEYGVAARKTVLDRYSYATFGQKLRLLIDKALSRAEPT